MPVELRIPEFTSPQRATAAGKRAAGVAIGSAVDEAIANYKESRQREGHVGRLADDLELKIVKSGEYQRFGFDTQAEAQEWMTNVRARLTAEGVTVEEVEKMIPAALADRKKIAEEKKRMTKGARGTRALTGETGVFTEGAGAPATMEEGIDQLVKTAAAKPAEGAAAGPGAPATTGIMAGVPTTAAGEPARVGPAKGSPTVQLREMAAEFIPPAGLTEDEQSSYFDLQNRALRMAQDLDDAVLNEAMTYEQAWKEGRTFKEKLYAEKEKLRKLRGEYGFKTGIETMKAKGRARAAALRAQGLNQLKAADLQRKALTDIAKLRGDLTGALASQIAADPDYAIGSGATREQVIEFLTTFASDMSETARTGRMQVTPPKGEPAARGIGL